eukprot:6184998-Pleurochrysis_carterae.AAC.2
MRSVCAGRRPHLSALRSRQIPLSPQAAAPFPPVLAPFPPLVFLPHSPHRPASAGRRVARGTAADVRARRPSAAGADSARAHTRGRHRRYPRIRRIRRRAQPFSPARATHGSREGHTARVSDATRRSGSQRRCLAPLSSAACQMVFCLRDL